MLSETTGERILGNTKLAHNQAAGSFQQLEGIGLPDIRFLSPDGQVFCQMRGYQNTKSFAVELGTAFKPNQDE